MNRVSQNIYVLYFLFIATLVHFGYFVIHSETQSIVLFALMITFVYLIHKNMVIVLGISIVFTDLFYFIQHMPEGFTTKDYDPSITSDASGIGVKPMYTQSTLDLSGNKTSTGNTSSNTSGNNSTGNTSSNTSGNNSTGNTSSKPSGNTSVVNITPTSTKSGQKDAMTNQNTPVNPIVGAKETIGQNSPEIQGFETMEGRDLNEVQQDSAQMKKMINKLKESPEIAESFKQLPGLDISELNRLMNNLNKVVDSFA